MEDMNIIVDAISNVGFPIAMCGLFYIYTVRQSERHEKEITALKEAVHNNTTVLAELSTLIKHFINK